MKYTFWYKRKVEAKSLAQAIKVEKKQKMILSSIVPEEEHREELQPLIGFQVEQFEE